VSDDIESFAQVKGYDGDKLVTVVRRSVVVVVCKIVIRAAVVDPDVRKAN